jgi:5-methylcytosine-specific restriction enzyme subunit McrC
VSKRIHRQLPEFGRLYEADIGPRLWARLLRFDSARVRIGQPPVFDWARRDYARARNLVGVLQLPGILVEILPKVDVSEGEGGDEVSPDAQSNLLYMLEFVRRLPVTDVGLAELAFSAGSLHDALARVFAENLHREIVRGLDRDYVRHEAELPYVRGQILIHEQIRKRPYLQDRLWNCYDEFNEDTLLNRVLKAAARSLASDVRDSSCVGLLNRIIEEFDGVRDVEIHESHVHEIVLNRLTLRFEPLLDFACLVLFGGSPAPQPGKRRSFSMLIPMDRLFEEFFARFVRRYANRLGLERGQIHPQAVGQRRWLLHRIPDERGAFRLKPDLIVERHGEFPGLVLDTKWKRLASNEIGTRKGVAESDMYQVFAYATRFGYADNVILYPYVEGSQPQSFRIPDTDSRIRIETIRLDRDLRRDLPGLIEETRNLLHANPG